MNFEVIRVQNIYGHILKLLATFIISIIRIALGLLGVKLMDHFMGRRGLAAFEVDYLGSVVGQDDLRVIIGRIQDIFDWRFWLEVRVLVHRDVTIRALGLVLELSHLLGK